LTSLLIGIKNKANIQSKYSSLRRISRITVQMNQPMTRLQARITHKATVWSISIIFMFKKVLPVFSRQLPHLTKTSKAALTQGAHFLFIINYYLIFSLTTLKSDIKNGVLFP